MRSPYPIPLKNRWLAGLLAWLVPGLGHLYQGRYLKAIIFAVCIHGLFWTGMAQGDWKVVWYRNTPQEFSWPYLAQFGMGAAALPALVSDPADRTWLPEPLKSFEVAPPEDVLDKLHLILGKHMEVAIMYTIIAGLLNYLVIYDAVAGPAHADEEERELDEAKKQSSKRDGESE